MACSHLILLSMVDSVVIVSKLKIIDVSGDNALHALKKTDNGIQV